MLVGIQNEILKINSLGLLKRLLEDKTTKTNIQNNIKIRPETIKLLWQIREKSGIRNTLYLIIKTIF